MGDSPHDTPAPGAIPLGSPPERTLSVGAVVRLTGLSEHTLRAWERRYQAVVPLRTPRGTRRYRQGDVHRLRLLRDAVAAGHRIGDLAALTDDALRALGLPLPAAPPRSAAVEGTLRALADLDAEAAHREVAGQLAALGPRRFIDEYATPLLHAVGDAWEREAFCIASEHLASAMVRSALESALRGLPERAHGPRIVFATLPGERHEIGLLVAALVARGAGARPVYLGVDLPVGQVALAVARSGARVAALSCVQRDAHAALLEIVTLRDALPRDIDVWIGGPVAFEAPLGTSIFPDLDAFEAGVRALAARAGGRTS